jgi:hypothetical protein
MNTRSRCQAPLAISTGGDALLRIDRLWNALLKNPSGNASKECERKRQRKGPGRRPRNHRNQLSSVVAALSAY